MHPLGAYLKHQRTLRGQSLREFAAAAQIPYSTLHRIEQGYDFQFSALPGIAAALDMGVGDLLVAAGYTVRGERVVTRAASAQDWTITVEGWD